MKKERAPSRIGFHKGLDAGCAGDALSRLELRATSVVHVAAVWELVLREVLIAEIVDTVGLRLAVVGVHLRRQRRCLAEMVVPDVRARGAGLEIHEMQARRADCNFRLRLLLPEL